MTDEKYENILKLLRHELSIAKKRAEEFKSVAEEREALGAGAENERRAEAYYTGRAEALGMLFED